MRSRAAVKLAFQRPRWGQRSATCAVVLLVPAQGGPLVEGISCADLVRCLVPRPFKAALSRDLSDLKA
jgi:hypothetical protein